MANLGKPLDLTYKVKVLFLVHKIIIFKSFFKLW